MAAIASSLGKRVGADIKITAGNASIMVGDMDRAVTFYTETLGLSLKARYGNHFAEVSAPDGFTIGLHPASAQAPKPGAPGAISVGLRVPAALDAAVRAFEAKGVRFQRPKGGDAGRIAHSPIRTATRSICSRGS